MLAAAILVAVVVGIGAARAVHARSLTAWSERQRRMGTGGVAIGAEGFVLERTHAPAVLLLHGAGDTPQSLRYLAEHLFAGGYHVAAPLLPAHGRRIADFARLDADTLTLAALNAYKDVRATHDWTAVIGLSMGGALAVQVAAATPDLPALGLAAPYLELPIHVARAARWSRVWGAFLPVVRSGEGVSVLDPIERDRNLAYRLFTPGALRALATTVARATEALPRVAAPTLIVQSRTDNRISVSAAENAFAALGAAEKRLEWISGASHVITVDFGREAVFAAFASWFEAHGAKTAGS